MHTHDLIDLRLVAPDQFISVRSLGLLNLLQLAIQFAEVAILLVNNGLELINLLLGLWVIPVVLIALLRVRAVDIGEPRVHRGKLIGENRLAELGLLASLFVAFVGLFEDELLLAYDFVVLLFAALLVVHNADEVPLGCDKV